MSIWFGPLTLEELNKRGLGTLVEHLEIVFTEIGPDFLSARMPVDKRTKQPVGLLHGGASVALMETIASTAANLVVDRKKVYCVGLEINANHVRSISDGFVVGTSRPLHLGRTTQVWQTEIREGEKLISVGRMTLSVLSKPAA
jgi:1,4-dihydroxy-2-naphthoyl-CoA hydrolase